MTDKREYTVLWPAPAAPVDLGPAQGLVSHFPEGPYYQPWKEYAVVCSCGANLLRSTAAEAKAAWANHVAAAVLPDNKPDGSGLDDGPYLPGRAPRKKPAPKSPEELAAIRAKAWATRRAKA
jgi:hypothetical protein